VRARLRRDVAATPRLLSPPMPRLSAAIEFIAAKESRDAVPMMMCARYMPMRAASARKDTDA